MFDAITTVWSPAGAVGLAAVARTIGIAVEKARVTGFIAVCDSVTTVGPDAPAAIITLFVAVVVVTCLVVCTIITGFAVMDLPIAAIGPIGRAPAVTTLWICAVAVCVAGAFVAYLIGLAGAIATVGSGAVTGAVAYVR